jgi:hypothetical protein
MQFTDPRQSVLYKAGLGVIRNYTQRALVQTAGSQWR